MAFVSRTLPALLLAATTSLALLAPHTAEARNGQNAALIAGALLGVAAGSALAQSGQTDGGGYTEVEPAPRPVYRPRDEVPVYDDGDSGERYRPVYRDDGPRYRVIEEAWPRHDWRRGFGERPGPERDWRHHSED